MIYNLDDTICAQSTPPGRGGIHVLRVSGANSLKFVSQIAPNLPSSSEIETNKVYYGFIVDPTDDRVVDEVMVTYFQKGRSFTTEATVEIACHGNPLIVKEILTLLLQQGCRMAERGEFTYRAFKGGRLTLAQAEAVLSLIEANTSSSAAKSLELLSGDGLSSVKSVEEELIWVISRLEARIDFSTEDIEIEPDSEISDRLSRLADLLESSLSYYKRQNIRDQGLKTVILGPPNAGKSSLFNSLIGNDRSIVSAIPGTTRDYLSETIHLHGLPFQIVDTAGLRLEADEIERHGIAKVSDLAEIADLILVLVAADRTDFTFLDILKQIDFSKKLILVVNKVDLNPKFRQEDLRSLVLKSDRLSVFDSKALQKLVDSAVFISVKDQIGIDSLVSKMVSFVDSVESSEHLTILNLRHADIMSSTLREIKQGLQVLQEGLGDEFILSHLNRGLKSLVTLTSESNEEVIRDKIFKDFCLGK